MSALAVGEVRRAGVEDAGPHVCTHNTDAGLDQEDNSPFQDAAQAGSPSLLGRGGGKCLGVFPHFSLPTRRMKMGSILVAFLCHLLFLPSLPALRDTCRGRPGLGRLCLNGAAVISASQLPPLLWCWGQCRILNHSFCLSQPREPQAVIPSQ